MGVGPLSHRPRLRHRDMADQAVEPMELLVERLGARGDGIAEHGGEPVFLPFTVPGDRVRARLGARRGGGREGRVIELLNSGKGRADPPCAHFGRCGGCALQHLDRDSYEAVKLGALHRALERVGIDPGLVQQLRVVAPARRRTRLRLVRPRDPRLSARVGFRERFRHDLVDLRECPVLEPGLFTLVDALRRIAGDVMQAGRAAEVTLTRTDSGVDVLIEAEERPELSALEPLAGFAENCDLARDPLPPEALAGYAAAVFDPPRAGATRQAAALAAAALKTVVAVSCNPATYARDAAQLIAGGFRLARIVPVDQFVWTPHLELAAVFRR